MAHKQKPLSMPLTHCLRHEIELDEKHECILCVAEDDYRRIFCAAEQDAAIGRYPDWEYEDYKIEAWRQFLELHPSTPRYDWKRRYEEESKTVSMVWNALGCKTYDDCKPFTIWEHVERLKAQRDALLAALKFMYSYFVMPGHAQQAKDCPNNNCPFCKAESAIAAAEVKP